MVYVLKKNKNNNIYLKKNEELNKIPHFLFCN